jgi:hypothetical protein
MSQSTTPFFGRAYSLTITPSTGPSAGVPIVVTSDTFEPQALRITFNVVQLAFSAFWQAEITIWNADGYISTGPSVGKNLYQSIIQEGDIVTLSAGYQADYPSPSTPPAIFTGPIFYTIQDRVDVVDKRLILHCLLNRLLTTQNFLNATVPSLSTQFTQARFIAQSSLVEIPIQPTLVEPLLDSDIPGRGATQLPRGKSYFGTPHTYLKALADQNSLLSWFDNKGWNLASLQKAVGDVVATYAPLPQGGGPPEVVDGVTLTLIGQPKQTQFGVEFRVLLDPRVQVVSPLCQVGLQMQFIRQAPIEYPIPSGGVPVPLVSQYIVVGVSFSGDTRGNEWYTDITGIAQIVDVVQLLGQSQQAVATSNR